ncbi:MAG TPA: D-glycero-beta-D-manno-heptose-7-phosphate kinase [Candidatus Paceibacterota bacterium]|nr:D-glycero-beta-D-manno-heptose-7-phosphate kinase [Candidatus Paceibacterota bacterium]
MDIVIKNNILDVILRFENKRIAIIGDLMLDRYLWGSAIRISPEAPVPVVDIDQESNRLGGSANVANNIITLGGIAYPIGLIGNDHNGNIILELMNSDKFITDGIIKDPNLPTTVKTRVIANNQHVVRIDRENKHTISEKSYQLLFNFIEANIKSFDAIIFEDYNKGVITKELIKNVINLAKKHSIPVTVDPKFDNFFEFVNVDVFKPNRKEAEEAIGQKIKSDEDLFKVMQSIQRKINCANLLLTRGEKGMALMEKNGEITLISTRARNIADVSGAGDTVISTLTMALVSGATPKEAAVISNFAAGIVCEEVGVVPIRKDILINKIQEELTK